MLAVFWIQIVTLEEFLAHADNPELTQAIETLEVTLFASSRDTTLLTHGSSADLYQAIR
ncbi:MAG: hypothetical protein ACFBSC_17685 [Microcoleaceae cyanobacterium]